MATTPSNMRTYWWTNTGVLTVVALAMALTVRSVTSLPWFGWLAVVLVCFVVAHLIVERVLSAYTNTWIARALARRDARRIAKQVKEALVRTKAEESPWLRQLIVEQVQLCDDPTDVYGYLITRADRERWPAWAVMAMPLLYVPAHKVKSRGAWAYLAREMAESLAGLGWATVRQQLCGGVFVMAQLTQAGVDLGTRAARFGIPGYSARARLGAALHAFQETELVLRTHDPIQHTDSLRQAEAVAATRKSLLLREGISGPS